MHPPLPRPILPTPMAVPHTPSVAFLNFSLVCDIRSWLCTFTPEWLQSHPGALMHWALSMVSMYRKRGVYFGGLADGVGAGVAGATPGDTLPTRLHSSVLRPSTAGFELGTEHMPGALSSVLIGPARDDLCVSCGLIFPQVLSWLPHEIVLHVAPPHTSKYQSCLSGPPRSDAHFRWGVRERHHQELSLFFSLSPALMAHL